MNTRAENSAGNDLIRCFNDICKKEVLVANFDRKKLPCALHDGTRMAHITPLILGTGSGSSPCYGLYGLGRMAAMQTYFDITLALVMKETTMD